MSGMALLFIAIYCLLVRAAPIAASIHQDLLQHITSLGSCLMPAMRLMHCSLSLPAINLHTTHSWLYPIATLVQGEHVFLDFTWFANRVVLLTHHFAALKCMCWVWLWAAALTVLPL